MIILNQQYCFLTFLRKWCGLILSIFLVSCADNTSTTQIATNNSNPQYFDVTGFIQNQISLLNQQQPEATKTVVEGGKAVETKTIKGLNWQKELESFTEVD